MDSSVITAYATAKNSLRKCYGAKGILATPVKPNEYIARNGFWASLGAVRLEDFEPVQKHLELFLHHQRHDGLIPHKISKSGVLKKIFSIDPIEETSSFYVENRISFIVNPVSDTNALLIISFANYVAVHKDVMFVNRYLDRLKLAFDWQLSNTKDYLLIEGDYAGWLPTVNRRSYSLYTNILYYKSALGMSEVFKVINDYESSTKFLDLAQKIKAKIIDRFWVGDYFADFLDKNFAPMRNFSVDGNMLAVLWGISTPTLSTKVLDYYLALGLKKPFPSQAGFGGFPTSRFIWLGALVAGSYKVCGLDEEAEELLKQVSEAILKFQTVYDKYDDAGNPYQKIYKKSLESSSFDAGVVIDIASIFLKEN